MSLVARPKARRSGPLGALAWRQYQAKLALGHTATLGFSLADPCDPTMAPIKQAHDAAHMGLLVVLDDPNSLEEAVLWFERAMTLTLFSQNGEPKISDEVRRLLPRYFAVFFDEIKYMAPNLAKVGVVVPWTSDSPLH